MEQACKYDRIYRQDGQAGWLTTVVSRPPMLGRLGAALVESPGCFMSRALLGECRSFVRHRDGSTGAQSGTHDDRVMAMAMALGVREQGLGTRGWGPGAIYERRVARDEGLDAFGEGGLAQLVTHDSCLAGGGVHCC